VEGGVGLPEEQLRKVDGPRKWNSRMETSGEGGHGWNRENRLKPGTEGRSLDR